MARLLQAMAAAGAAESRRERGGTTKAGVGGGGGEDLPRGVRREVLRPPGRDGRVRHPQNSADCN
jgi:hypothetical protein